MPESTAENLVSANLPSASSSFSASPWMTMQPRKALLQQPAEIRIVFEADETLRRNAAVDQHLSDSARAGPISKVQPAGSIVSDRPSPPPAPGRTA